MPSSAGVKLNDVIPTPLAVATGVAPFMTVQAYVNTSAVPGSVALAVYVRRTVTNSREAGQTLMLYGLLWLIVYDVAFVAAFVGLVPALAILILLPLAYASVQLMRWWGRFVTLSQRPGFKRADA